MVLGAALRRVRLTTGLAGLLAGAVVATGVLSDGEVGIGHADADSTAQAGRAEPTGPSGLRVIDLTATGAGRTARDGDRDGWADWVEELEGTDPANAASTPGAVTLDIVGTIVCLRPAAHPDEVAVVDLSLPEGTVSGRDLLATFGALAGLNPGGVAHDRLAALVQTLHADGVLDRTGSAPTVGASRGLRKRVGGMDVPLVGGDDDRDLGALLQRDPDRVRTARLTVGLGRGGAPFLAVDNGTTVQWHAGHRRVHGGLAVHSLLASPVRDTAGRTTTYWERLADGRPVRGGTLVGDESRVDAAAPWTIDATFPWT